MKKGVLITGVIVGIALASWAIFIRGSASSSEIDYKYAKVEIGELIRSTTANGQVVALTTVDVKSKAGGKVLKLYVEEGSVVKKGDLIAEIDPSDTKSTFDQANADLTAAEAQAQQAQLSVEVEEKNAANSVKDSEVALQLAKIRLDKAKETAKVQPDLTKASIANAQANFDAQNDASRALEQVTIPQKRRDAQGNLDRSKAELESSKAELDRQKELFQKGYVSKSSVERAQSAFESANATYLTAQQRMTTLESEIKGDLDAQRGRLAQAKASLDQAKANSTQDFQSKKSLDEAERTVQQAELSLDRAKTQLLNVQIRKADLKSADASVLRNRIRAENADVNFRDATVRAPRDGIVTLKYLEEGTIIPPGTSTFSQGTSLVQISDVTTMYVECAVDEADIASVKKGQNVRITAEAFPGLPFKGIVERVSPAATTANNVTTIKVRVQVLGIDESAQRRGGRGNRGGQGQGQGQVPGSGQGQPGTQTPSSPPSSVPGQGTAPGSRPGANTTSRAGGLRQEQPPTGQTPPEGVQPGQGRRRGQGRPGQAQGEGQGTGQGRTGQGQPPEGGPGQGGQWRRRNGGTPSDSQNSAETAPDGQRQRRVGEGSAPGGAPGGAPGPGGFQGPRNGGGTPTAEGRQQQPAPLEQPEDAVLPVRPHPGNMQIVPGMNATVEFLTLEKKDVLVCPQQAIKSDAKGTYVLVKTKDAKKPERRTVKVGESGNDGVEILEGLKPGEEVVVAEINLAEMRETQRRMQEAAQGGGLAGGTGPRPGGNRPTTGGGGAGRAGGGGR